MARAADLALLTLLLPLSGCLHIWARDVEPTYPDRGADLPGNPYDHLAAPEYSQGRISGFRELLVEPEPFADALVPVAELPTDDIPMLEAPPLPADLAPVIQVQVDPSTLDESGSFDDVVDAVRGATKGLVVAMPTEGLVVLKAPENFRERAGLINTLGRARVGAQTLAKRGKIKLADALPEPITGGHVLPAEEGATLLIVAPGATPPRLVLAPETGTLPIDNITTSYADVTINGEHVGVIPPLAKARVRNIKAGFYNVEFLLPNAFTWTEKIATRSDMGPRVVISDGRIDLREQVLFTSGNATIRATSSDLLDEISQVLVEHPDIAKVRIEGHTDSDGDEAMNLKLSQDRAAAVVRALVARGISAERLDSEGFGESRPIASNKNDAGKTANRRVELIIVPSE